MNILFVTRKYPPSTGGMEVFSAELYAALTRARADDIQLYVPTPPIIGRPSIWQLARFAWGAARAIARPKKRFDAIILGDCLLIPLSLWARLIHGQTIKIIGTAHGNDIFFAGNTSISSRVYAFALRLFSRHLDLLIANSNTTAEAAKPYGFRRIEKVSLATSPQTIASCLTPRPTLLFAGRLIAVKGLSWFIENVLPGIDPQISLLVAGPAWDSEEMKALNSCDRAHYLGILDKSELALLRSTVIACIMPNLPPEISRQNEGFGLSALESPAVGTPVIATRCGGLAEAVVDGVTGFLIDPMDSSGFAARVHKIFSWSREDRETFAINARNEIAEHFNWDRVASDYLRLIELMEPIK